MKPWSEFNAFHFVNRFFGSARGGRLLAEIELVKPHGDRDRLVFRDQKIEVAQPAAQEAALLESANAK